MNNIIPCEIHCFYITSVLLNNLNQTVKKHVYFTKPATSNYLLELICRTNTGQTLGYFKKEDKIFPVEEDIDKTQMLNWGYEDYLKGVLDFCEIISKYDENYSSLELCYFYHDYVLEEYDKNIANTLGDIPFCLIGKENKILNTSKKLNFFEILKYFLFGKDSLKNIEIPELSLIRSGINIKKITGFFDFKIQNKFLEENKLNNLLKRNKNKKLVLWGASLFLEAFIKKYNIEYDNIVAIVDKNPMRQNQTIGKYNIISPEELIKVSFDSIILTVKNRNEQAYLELKAIIKNKFPNKKLLPNVFDNSLFSFIKYSDFNVNKTSIQNLEIKINNLENNLNRLMQNNLSTFQMHQKTFMQFKGIHKDREIVILATGPSAKYYIPIKNAIHIGVNRAFQMNKTDLDYVFIQDYSGKTPEYIKELNEYNKGKCIKFYGLTNERKEYPNQVIPESYAIEANALRYRTDWAKIEAFSPQFTYDISSAPLGCFGTIVFPALQFALWTNPKRIYLVGCDCSLAGYAYNSLEQNYLPVNELINHYKEFKNFAYKYYPETEIVSVNPVGLKGIFNDLYQDRANISQGK